jgi:HEAT repeat protein
MSALDLNDILRATDPVERHRRIVALASALPSITEVAEFLLEDGGPEHRWIAVELLGHVDPSDRRACARAAHLLTHALQSFDPRMRAAAAVALAKLPQVPDLTKLSALRRDPRPGVRSAVVTALGQRVDDEAVAGLIELSSDREGEIRTWAVFWLSQLPEPSAAVLTALAARLDDENPEVRGEAVCALAAAGDERALAGIDHQLRAEFEGVWHVEAAEHLPRAEFASLLEEQLATLDEESRSRFEDSFRTAIEACERAADEA